MLIGLYAGCGILIAGIFIAKLMRRRRKKLALASFPPPKPDTIVYQDAQPDPLAESINKLTEMYNVNTMLADMFRGAMRGKDIAGNS